MLRESHLLLFSIFIAGLCSIVYELLIATTGAYFLGDSITQFSLTIGIYMAFMGLGSYFSRFIKDQYLLAQFIGFELVLALFGGLAVPLLYLAYALGLPLQLISGVLTALIGILIGLEIPLLSRLMEKHYSLKANLANVLSIDYLGALLATLLFPFVLLPWLGIFKTSLAFGLINLTIALSLLWYFKKNFSSLQWRRLRLVLIIVASALIVVMVSSKWLTKKWNTQVFEDTVVHSEQSQYQQLVLTRNKDDIRLYLNGGLQFSTIDEYRYHETLVHPAMARIVDAKRVLVLGGGDGLAIRELLKYPTIEQITLVDLDPAVARLARDNVHVSALNQGALTDPKVTVVHQDGFVFIEQNKTSFDLILVDLPDPKSISLARLYSLQFYVRLRQNLTEKGILVTQATSPFFAKKAFWSIHNTLSASGFKTIHPLHVNVPSFGEWGFIMACHSTCRRTTPATLNTRFYSAQMEPQLFTFSKDLLGDNEKISTLDKPEVLYYYLEGWRYWN